MSVLMKTPLFGTPNLDTPLLGAEGGATPEPAPAPARRRGAANYGWRKLLESWRKQREEEEEAERKRLERELEKALGPIRARELLARERAMEAERLEAESLEICLVGAMIGDDDE